MGDAIRKESSMEDILSSIRKIISSETRTKTSDAASNATPDAVSNATKSDAKDASIRKIQAQKRQDKVLKTAAPVAPQKSPVANPVASPVSSPVAKPVSNTVMRAAPKAQPATAQPAQSTMSSTLESIRAAVIGKKPDMPKDAPKADAVAKGVPRSKVDTVTVSTSATPLAINNENNTKSEHSLADLAEQLNSVTNSESNMSYANPQEQSLEAQIPAPKAVSEEKAASASALNFKSFAQSVQKPIQPVKTPDDFMKDDVAIFAEDGDASAQVSKSAPTTVQAKEAITEELTESKVSTQQTTTQNLKVESKPQLHEKPETQVASIKRDALRGPISDTIGETVNKLVSDTIADDKTTADTATNDTKPVAETDKFKEALVSPTTKAAVTGSIERLRQSMDDVNTAHVENVLRPMLREWLDNNLPDMVEKIVREEISRITQEPKNTK
ncbi:MAG: DUF2497 domain-containing protein [Rhizobiales bacterium]|nr:DUF2497 domain-containing protein [Hyphomicrobiales bacterium]